MCGGQAAQAVDFVQRRENPTPGIAIVNQLQLAVLRRTRQMQDADGVECIICRYIVETPAQPVAEDIGICSAHGFAGQQTAVGGTAPDGLVTLPRGDALCLQLFKIVTAQRHKIGQPSPAARDQLAAKVRQRVRCAVRLHRIKAAADGGGHRLAGGVGDLIQQHGLVAFPPQIVQRALGEGVEVEHRRAGKVAVFQHPRHGAELVVGQCPIGVGGHAVGGKRAVPDLDAALRQLAAERLRHGSIRQQGHCAGRILRFGAAQRHDGAAVIDRAAQIGGVPLAVAVQRGECAENQIFHGQTPPLHTSSL